MSWQPGHLRTDARSTWDDRLAATVRPECPRTDAKPVEPAGFPEFPTDGAVHADLKLGTEPALRGTAAAAGLMLLFVPGYALLVTD